MLFCVTPVLHAGCGGMVQGLMSSHGRVQSNCCAVVVTLSLPLTSVGRLRVTVLVRCAVCVHRELVPVDVWFVS